MKTTGGAERIGGMLLTAYLCVLIPALSFYMPDGYQDLGNAKFAAWRALTLPFGAALLVCAALLPAQRRREARSGASAKTADTAARRFLLPDAAALLYGVFLTISVALSVDRGESLWGTTGWHMGFLTELCFLAYYFFARLFPIRLRAVGAVAGISAAAVLAVAIADRFGVYFLSFMGTDPAFLSTIGNVDWYGGYLALALSLAAGLWVAHTDGTRERTAAGTLKWIFSSVLLFLAALSLATLETESRYLIMLAAAALLAAVTLNGDGAAERAAAGAARGAAAAAAAAPILLTLLYCDPAAAGEALGGSRPLGLLTDAFGNGRGAIWRISWALWRELPWYRKLFGIGPDAYAAYVYTSPQIGRMVSAAFGAARLTNAHSELFTVFVDEGAPAAAACALFLGSALFSCARRRRGQNDALTLTAIFAIVVVSVEQAVTFRTVTATPFLFIIIGAALRGTESGANGGAAARIKGKRRGE